MIFNLLIGRQGTKPKMETIIVIKVIFVSFRQV
jgi:hypothetical protein